MATVAAPHSGQGQQPSTSTLSNSQSTRSARSHSINASDRPVGQYESENDEEGGYDGEDGEDDEDEGGMTRSSEQGHDLVSETTVKSGYLYKRGEKRKNWKKRWFVLRSAKLYYYKNEKEYQLLRFIDMTEVHTIAAVELKKADNCFGISTSKRQYYVRASTAKEMQQWIDAMREVREQVRQRSTLTRDMAMVDIGSSGGENGPQTQRPAKPTKSGSTSPQLQPVDRAQPGSGSSQGRVGSTPISIVIPGKGLYTSPAQPKITTGGLVVSPLSATSDSDIGGPSGAEQFGLSYTSSAGQSLASSPGRGGILQHHQALLHHDAGKHAGEESGEGRSSRIMRRASGLREASVGSSTSDTAALPASAAPLNRRSSSQQPPPSIQVHSQAQVLSSSDEDEGDGDEWDEDEEADRAMPLPSPGGLGLLSPHTAHTPAVATVTSKSDSVKGQSSNDTIQQAQVAKPKVAPEFFKDSSKVIHQGYLMKQSSRRKHWRKRWFVLTSSELSYSLSLIDAKLARQIPLSSILDAIEYTSKKQLSQLTGGAPLSPSLSAFSAAGANLPFGRSPLLGGGNEGGSGSAAAEKRSNSLVNKPSTASAGAQSSSDVEHPHPTTSGAGASSGNELDATPVVERKVQVASNQPTAASARAAEEQRQPSGSAPHPSTPAKRKKENCFKIITPKRVYVVGAPTEEEELKWLSALQALLAHYQDQKDVTPTSTQAQTIQSPPLGSTAQQQSIAPASGSLSNVKPGRTGSQDDTPVATAHPAAATVSASEES